MANKMDFTINVKTTADLQGIQNVSSQLDKLKAEANKFNMPGVVSAANQVQTALTQAFNPKINMVDINKFNASLAASGTSLGQVAADFNRMGTQGRQAYIGLINQSLQMGTAIKSTSSALDKMATTFKNTIRYSISSLTFQKITSEIASTISYVKELDTSLNNIQIVTGKNADEMARFAKEANTAAQALGTTTKSYSEASLIFYQQGLDSSAVKERTDVTMQMANVTKDSADEVSSYMTAIWNNYDDGSKSLEHYADVITALGASTASSSAEIAEGLEKFASIGNTVGLSYEYATSALATVVATTRQSADTVGTAFKTLFARIQDLELGNTLDDGTTLGQYSEALLKIGVNIKDANGEVKSMDTILNEMGSKWGTISKDTQIAVAQAVAGKEKELSKVA